MAGIFLHPGMEGNYQRAAAFLALTPFCRGLRVFLEILWSIFGVSNNGLDFLVSRDGEQQLSESSSIFGLDTIWLVFKSVFGNLMVNIWCE